MTNQFLRLGSVVVDGDRAARLDSGRWIQADVVDVMEVR